MTKISYFLLPFSVIFSSVGRPTKRQKEQVELSQSFPEAELYLFLC